MHYIYLVCMLLFFVKDVLWDGSREYLALVPVCILLNIATCTLETSPVLLVFPKRFHGDLRIALATSAVWTTSHVAFLYVFAVEGVWLYYYFVRIAAYLVLLWYAMTHYDRILLVSQTKKTMSAQV